jgi:hypothetical protein
MGGGEHYTPQEIGTKCGTNGVMAISSVKYVTSPNPTTTTKAIILTISTASKGILPLSQLPPEFDLNQMQPLSQLKRGVIYNQLYLLGYVPSQVFVFTTPVDCHPQKPYLIICCNKIVGFANPTPRTKISTYF